MDDHATARWTIGDVTVTKVIEQVRHLPLTALLPTAEATALDRHGAWLRPHFIDETGATDLSIHSFLVESEGVRILVDTCVGDREIPGVPGLRGPEDFPIRLAAAGFAPDSIDVVCCTHLHFDHVGWNTRLEDGRWVPTFTSARYLFCRDEYAHWDVETGHYASTFDDAVRPIVEAGRADLVAPDHRITSEVRFVPSPGHSPGHVSVLIESGGRQALITGDATHHPVQWAEIDWGMNADWDTEMAAATRRQLRDEHSAAGTLVLGTHYAAPSAGHIVRSGDRFEFHAAHG